MYIYIYSQGLGGGWAVAGDWRVTGNRQLGAVSGQASSRQRAVGSDRAAGGSAALNTLYSMAIIKPSWLSYPSS